MSTTTTFLAAFGCSAFFLVVDASAQDARDDEIFGASEGDATMPAVPAAAAAPAVTSAVAAPMIGGLSDTLQIGGRLEVRANTANEEHQKFALSSFQELKQADLYFDARPNKDLRVFLRSRFTEEKPSQVPTPAKAAAGAAGDGETVSTAIDELWFKTDYADSIFVTVGKQHLKWGSGRFWNPTDFTALETRDPFALFDRRLGQELIKVHVPMEKQGHNFYAVVQLDDAERNDDLGGALRAELAFGGIGEAAFSYQTQHNQAQRYGVDVSAGVGPVDLNLETAYSKRQQRTFFEGKVDPVTGQLPRGFQDEDKGFVQSVGGVQHSWKYSDDDNLTLGAEYYHNALGYDDRKLGLYSLVQGQSQLLTAGRSYAGAYLRVPAPGSWNDTSFFLNGLRNNVDETAVARFTTTIAIHKDATLEAFVSRCFGDYGELCFRVPETYKLFATIPTLSDEQKARLVALPTRRTLWSAGFGLSASL